MSILMQRPLQTASNFDFASEIVRYGRKLLEEGLTSGTGGNLSAREPGADWFYVSPSGIPYPETEPEDIVRVDLSGKVLSGRRKPSTDTMNHVAIYRARKDVNGVIHTHSTYALVHSILRREIPALVQDWAGILGGPVPVMEYLPPATPELGERAAVGLGGGPAVLLPNHGVIAVGPDLDAAFTAALTTESLARISYLCSSLGEPHALPESEVRRMHEYIETTYGQR